MMSSWAAEEVGSAELGDRRRTARLVQLVDRLAANPAASVPAAWQGKWAGIKATYRFWSSPAVTPAAIIASQREATVRRCAAFPVILAIQDTTELNFTHHPQTQGLGHLRAVGQRGILLHSTLAVSATGIPLGLLDQHAWARDPPTRVTKARRTRETAEKESQRWLDGEAAALAALPQETTVLSIMDREGDLFDLLAAPRRPGAFLLIRAAQTRRIADTPAGERAYSWPTLVGVPPSGQVTVEVRTARETVVREATLAVRYQQIELQVPRHHHRRSQYQPVRVVAILATELAPPPGQPPICWRLLTTWPLESPADALAMIEVYSLRWLIERYHFVLKSGCRVEQLQMEQEARLERAVATYSLVALRILRLTYLSRRDPEAPVQEELTAAEWAVLHARFPSLAEQPTSREVVRSIATLGGFLGRRGDGEPGVVVIWRGLQRLHDLALGWELHQTLTSSSQLLTGYG
jgi:hypothetical protein